MEQESDSQVVHIGYSDKKHNMRIGVSANGNNIQRQILKNQNVLSDV